MKKVSLDVKMTGIVYFFKMRLLSSRSMIKKRSICSRFLLECVFFELATSVRQELSLLFWSQI